MFSVTPPDTRKPRSILTTIIVLMTLSMTVLFIAFAAFHLSAGARAQRRDHEQYISTTLHFIRAELEGTLEEGEFEQEELDEIEDVVLRENASRRFGKVIVEIVDEQGTAILATSGAADLASMNPPFPPPVVSPGDATIDYWEAGDGTHFVLSSLRTHAPEGRIRRVHIALDWSEAEDKTEAFRRESILAILVCTLLAAIAAAFVTRHALRPLSVIRDAAENIRRGSFDERLDPKSLPVELDDLALSFTKMQEHLRESFERLSQFSAELAHELRTPLNNLMGENEVALSKSRTSDEYRELLSSNLEEMNRLARIIERLLFLAHASRGSAKFDAEPLDLAEEVDEVIEYHRAQADEISVTIVRSGDGRVQGDRTLVRRALSNVLSNALDASSKGGTIAITVEDSSNSVAITITDEGTGIDEINIPHVFDRFHRSKDSRTRRPEGNGLGLSIVKSVLELHGGSVSITSRPREGTSVRLVLPHEMTKSSSRSHLPEINAPLT